ncbi:MAG: DUF1858 domain-containing protein [Patescibacteria group bacterium]|nr:DUF1858 domain-containing protein [Patescibacteria group bacterium]
MFNKDTTLFKILKNPDNEKILVKYNLPCLTCPLADMEMEELKIGDICKMYGIDADKLLAALNKNSKKK